MCASPVGEQQEIKSYSVGSQHKLAQFSEQNIYPRRITPAPEQVISDLQAFLDGGGMKREKRKAQ
jgi:hypothetical protein